MDTKAFIAAQRARPITHLVQTAYADGRVKTHETRSPGAAENWAVLERRKIGMRLRDRSTGKNVTVVSVDIETL